MLAMVVETETLDGEGPGTAAGRARLDRERARAARWVVVLPEGGAAIPLSEAPIELGRDTLGHGSVSRRHVAIDWSDGAHGVTDLGSKNGSWLDGTPLGATRRRLDDQAVLRVGGVVMVYERGAGGAGDERETPALPGRSRAMATLRAAVARAAPDPAPALILGETGVGKEAVARELHRASGRPGPFVAVNVAELSERLVESQLFGHVKGAFTGADAAQPGLFRAAHRGTLLLDEIGELPLELQAKLLRVIQEREVRAVGATRTEPIDVRVVAATHAALAERVNAGSFRRDLWARLCMWELSVPPLSARRADVLAWVRRFGERWRVERGLAAQAPPRFEPDAVAALVAASFPENLRGLERLVHRLGERQVITLSDLAPHLAWAPPPKAATATAAAPATAPRPSAPTSGDELLQAFAVHGSVRALAKHYARDKRQIYRWLDAFGVRDAVGELRTGDDEA